MPDIRHHEIAPLQDELAESRNANDATTDKIPVRRKIAPLQDELAESRKGSVESLNHKTV